jgi:hypothetical protein
VKQLVERETDCRHRSVLYGTERIGHVVEQDGGWWTYDANGKKLGVYATLQTAARATRRRYCERHGYG